MIGLSLSAMPRRLRQSGPAPLPPEAEPPVPEPLHQPPLPEPPAPEPPAPQPQPDSFTAPDGTTLTAYTGESGLGWSEPDWPNVASIHSGQLRSATGATIGLARRGGARDLRDQFAQAQMVMKSNAENVLNGVGLALCISGPRHGYVLMHTGRRWYLARQAGNTRTQLAALNSRYAAGEMHLLRFSAMTTPEGCRLQIWLNGALLLDYTDPPEVALTGGAPGICAFGEGPDRIELNSFDGGPL